MQQWKTISRKTILKHSKFLAVEDHSIELPNGRVIENWSWLNMPDYVIVVAMTDAEEFLCFRQTKYAVIGTSLAPIGGYVEPGEDPLATAKRELREETGFESPEWLNLGHYVSDGNHGAGTAHLFLARRSRKVTVPRPDDLEEQRLLRLSKPQLEKALTDGEFKVLAWAAGVALALRAASLNATSA